MGLEKIIKGVQKGLVSLILLTGSCSNSAVFQKPVGRIGYFFGSGQRILDSSLLGNHNENEKNGLVYTCKGGFIDLAHLRKSADWTNYLYQKTKSNLLDNKSEFEFKLKEPSKYFVKLKFPENWQSLNDEDKKQILEDVSIDLGEYFSYTAVTWHEILTAMGYKSTGIFSENASAFSPEDNYSNLLGCCIAKDILRKEGPEDFNNFMTKYLKRELENLRIQNKERTREIEKEIKGKWYKGSFPFMKLIKKTFDIGLDSGFVRPWIVKGACESEVYKEYPIPNLDCLGKYGFSIQLHISPNVWEGDKILSILGDKKTIQPETDFKILIDYIREREVKKYGVNVDNPYR